MGQNLEVGLLRSQKGQEAIRHGRVQYLVWDAFSAGRSPFFSAGIRRYADRYNGRVVHTQLVPGHTRSGKKAMVPGIVIWTVRP